MFYSPEAVAAVYTYALTIIVQIRPGKRTAWAAREIDRCRCYATVLVHIIVILYYHW